MLKDIIKIDEYLTLLEKIKQDVCIYITVGDQFFNEKTIKTSKEYQDYITHIADTFRGWGVRFSADTNSIDCFVGVLEKGAVCFDSSSDKSVTYEHEHCGLSLKLIANSYLYDGDMHIYVNGVDYAYYTTGVAFLIIDKNSDTIIDAATFDPLPNSEARRFSVSDQMALYEKHNTDGTLDKYLSNRLIYVAGEEIPLFYDFIKNHPCIDREKLFSDKERTVGELTFRFALFTNAIVLTTHPKVRYRHRMDSIIRRSKYLIDALYKYDKSFDKSPDIAKKIYEEGNLADKNRIGIFFVRATGDVYYTLSISKVYEKESGKKPVFINRESNREVFDLFSAYDLEYVLIPDDEFNSLWTTSEITLGEFFLKYNIWDYYNAGNIDSVIGKGWYKGICAALKIPCDESNKQLFIRPTGQSCDREMYIERDGIVPGNTVLLAPESLSEPMLPFQFWNGLQSVLEARGFKVLVMAYMDVTEHSMKGPFVKIPYCDAIDYVELCGYVVAKRSGFVDVISSAKVSLTTLSCGASYYSNMDIYKEGLRQESDGYYSTIFVDEKRIPDKNYAMEVISAMLKFTQYPNKSIMEKEG
jgi:hypothetical protein